MNNSTGKNRPSVGDSRASASIPSTSESITEADPRRASREEKAQGSKNAPSKRRRIPETVTRNACVPCKKARAKCDGDKPCKRCDSRAKGPECYYEVHIKQAKEELVKQVNELRAKDHLKDQILQALTSDEKIPEIVDRLRKGETYEAIVEWLGRPPTTGSEACSPRESHQSPLESQAIKSEVSTRRMSDEQQ